MTENLEFEVRHESDVPRPSPTATTRRVTRRRFLQATAAAAAVMATGEIKADTPKEAVKEKSHSEKMTEVAREYFAKNLKENREAAAVFHEMYPTIEEFAKYAGVKVVVCKCMDGRLHTNNHKLLPPTFAFNSRSQGNVIDVGVGNKDFRDRLEAAAAEAESEGVPLLIITSAHKGVIGSSCAAHKKEYDSSQLDGDRRAMNAVNEQALQLTNEIKNDHSINPQHVEVLSAMTNTDNGGMAFSKNSHQLFSAEEMLAAEELQDSPGVFEGEFLFAEITEDWAHESIRGKEPNALLAGEHAPFFSDMRIRIAFEAYLMRKVQASGGKGIIRHDILKRIQQHLGETNPKIRNFLTYMMAGNLAYTTHYRNLNDRLAKDDPAALQQRVSHQEKKLAFSYTGHDLEAPNSLILVKPGGGDDVKSVEIGKAVLEHNLEDLGLTGEFAPLVHINIEVEEPIETWEEYRNVVSRMRTKLAIVEHVFKKQPDVRVMTTYSYSQTVPTKGENGVVRTKQFFPLRANENPIIVTPKEQDLGNEMNNRSTFDPKKLRDREKQYTDSGLATAA